MDSSDIVKKNMKRTLAFQKRSFNYLFNSMILIQEQIEIVTFMTGLPVKNQALFDQMHNSFKKNCDYFKGVVDGGFEKAESFISSS